MLKKCLSMALAVVMASSSVFVADVRAEEASSDYLLVIESSSDFAESSSDFVEPSSDLVESSSDFMESSSDLVESSSWDFFATETDYTVAQISEFLPPILARAPQNLTIDWNHNSWLHTTSQPSGRWIAISAGTGGTTSSGVRFARFPDNPPHMPGQTSSQHINMMRWPVPAGIPNIGWGNVPTLAQLEAFFIVPPGRQASHFTISGGVHNGLAMVQVNQPGTGMLMNLLAVHFEVVTFSANWTANAWQAVTGVPTDGQVTIGIGQGSGDVSFNNTFSGLRRNAVSYIGWDVPADVRDGAYLAPPTLQELEGFFNIPEGMEIDGFSFSGIVEDGYLGVNGYLQVFSDQPNVITVNFRHIPGWTPPITEAPTTAAPTTVVPTTIAPTTAAPTTVASTTRPSEDDNSQGGNNQGGNSQGGNNRNPRPTVPPSSTTPAPASATTTPATPVTPTITLAPLNTVTTTITSSITSEIVVNLASTSLANPNRIMAIIDGHAIAGEFNPATREFTFETDLVGEFTIGYVGTRLSLQIGQPQVADLINNTTRFIDVSPTIVDDRALLPIRFVAEALGATVAWNEQTATATIALGNETISLTIDCPEMDVPAQIIGDRTMVPIRFVAEALGVIVNWDEETSGIEIIKL